MRKLVTLSPELAERVEKYRLAIAATSESDALKSLIEGGLKLRDRPYDLFRRCESATNNNQTIGEIVENLASDHPLVETTIVNSEGLSIYLKTEPDAPIERFHLPRTRRDWCWQKRSRDSYDENWETTCPIDPDEAPKVRPRRGSDLDDEIPF